MPANAALQQNRRLQDKNATDLLDIRRRFRRRLQKTELTIGLHTPSSKIRKNGAFQIVALTFATFVSTARLL